MTFTITITLISSSNDIKPDARHQPLGNPLAGEEVEHPLLARPCPAGWGRDVGEEASAPGPLAGEAQRGEGVEGRRGEEVGEPFGGRGGSGGVGWWGRVCAVLELEDLDFTGLGR